MTALLLGICWAAVVGWWALVGMSARAVVWHRTQAQTVSGDIGGPRHRARSGRAPLGPLLATAMQGVEAFGRGLRGVMGRSADPAAERRWVLAVVAGAPLLVVHPVLAAAPVVVALVGPRLSTRRRARRHESAVVDQLPDVVDLLRLTTSAGLPVSGAITAIGERPGGVVGGALVRAASLVARGGATAEALAALHTECGPVIRPLVDALADHDRYGTALGPALDRVGVESRLRRRRQAEEAARRLPIALLFPLVLTTLPAFVLLNVAL